MLLRTKLVKHANVKMNLPIIGEIQLVDGVVDVPKNIHDMMIGDGLNEWTSGEESALKATKKPEKIKPIPDQFEEMINALTFQEVIDLAKQANIAKYQLFVKNEKGLRTFVIKKLREADEERQMEELAEAERLANSEEVQNL